MPARSSRRALANDAETRNVTRQSDQSGAFVFQPAASWSVRENGSNETYHLTSVADASASLSFSGVGIYVFGVANGTHGLYSVQLDDGRVVTFNPNRSSFEPETLLFRATDLTPGQHTLVLSNDDNAPLTLDYAIITESSAQPPSASSSSGLSTPIKVAIGVGVTAVFLGLLAMLGWLSFRNRLREEDRRRHENEAFITASYHPVRRAGPEEQPPPHHVRQLSSAYDPQNNSLETVQIGQGPTLVTYPDASSPSPARPAGITRALAPEEEPPTHEASESPPITVPTVTTSYHAVATEDASESKRPRMTHSRTGSGLSITPPSTQSVSSSHSPLLSRFSPDTPVSSSSFSKLGVPKSWSLKALSRKTGQ